MLTIQPESPLGPDGLALIAGSQAALAEVFTPDEIFTLAPEELAIPDITFFVARTGGRPVGCVALMHCGSYGEVKRLFVGVEGRGRGIAKALMAHLEREAQAAGLGIVRLETGPPLVAAITLYDSLGYHRRGPFGDYADQPSSLFMEKSLFAPTP